MVPYGFPPIGPEKTILDNRKLRPLKLLFVGALTQRKGIADIFAAVSGLTRHVELTVVGKKIAENCPALNRVLEKHRWFPSLPHSDILRLMHASDALLFPSLFEGFGLVITEAMSQGTPVIQTHLMYLNWGPSPIW